MIKLSMGTFTIISFLLILTSIISCNSMRTDAENQKIELARSQAIFKISEDICECIAKDTLTATHPLDSCYLHHRKLSAHQLKEHDLDLSDREDSSKIADELMKGLLANCSHTLDQIDKRLVGYDSIFLGSFVSQTKTQNQFTFVLEDKKTGRRATFRSDEPVDTSQLKQLAGATIQVKYRVVPNSFQRDSFDYVVPGEGIFIWGVKFNKTRNSNKNK